MSSKKNIISLTVIIIILSLVITWAFVKYNESMVKTYSKTVHRSLVELVEQQVFNVETHIRADVRTLENIATVLTQYNGEMALSMEAIKPFLSNSSFENIFVLNLEGKGLLNSGEYIDLSDRKYFQRAIKGETVIEIPLKSRINNEIILPIATPILGVDGEIVGVLFGTYTVELLEKLVLPSYDGNGLTQMVTQNDELILSVGTDAKDYHWEDNEARQNYVNRATFVKGSVEQYIEDREKLISGYMEYKIDGKTMYVHYAPIGINDWYMNVAIDSNLAFPEIEEMHQNMLNFIYILFSCFTSIFISILLIILKRYKKTKFIARHDSLTKIYNRGTIEKEICKILNASKKMKGALFLVDLDNLKTINDELGHHMGDASIKDIAKTLDMVLGKSAIVGRIGGDEFLAVVPKLTKVSEIESKAREINESLSPLEDGRVSSVSIGIAIFESGNNFEEIRLKADQAMYYAKRNGKKSFVIWEEDLVNVKLRLEK